MPQQTKSGSVGADVRITLGRAEVARTHHACDATSIVIR
jgi:hypothetical protein